MENQVLAGSAAPTAEVYAELQQAFDVFNRELFEGVLPPCLITLQRERSTLGYFSRSRFARHTGQFTDEIAMHPGYFGERSIRDTLSTLVHEMVHEWQCHFGKPGRARYHNKQWAQRMEAVGLMPSDTGQPGGKTTGDSMDHYIIEGGAFDRTCAALLTTQFTLSWKDRFPPASVRPKSPPPAGDEDGGDAGEDPMAPAVNSSNRLKYRCPTCEVQVWGKPLLRILCGNEACLAAAFQVIV